MRLFISAGEPSGDLHGSNLIRHLRTQMPDCEITGFGGPKMQEAGSKLIYPLTNLAVMWIGSVLAHIRTFLDLADQAEDYFRTQKPDAVVLIDYPGFHWHIAKRAKKHGIPVYYFVPPQLWAWAGWRVRKMQRTVETVLTAMPFEDDWYKARRVNTHYIGHPYFDEIRQQKLDALFMEQYAELKSQRRIVGLLPGSRTQEVAKNGPTLISAAKKILDTRPDAKILVAAFNEKQANRMQQMASDQQMNLPIYVGKTAEIIQLSQACLAVSGSVSLELLTRTTPAAIVYRIHEFGRLIATKVFMKVPYISLPNILANELLYPEYLSSKDCSQELAKHILEWLNDENKRQEDVRRLEKLRDHCAIPGACKRAADYLVSRLMEMKRPDAILSQNQFEPARKKCA